MPEKKQPKIQPSPATSSDPSDAALALRSVTGEMNALSPDEVMGIRIDVPRAVSTALGALPKIMAARGAIIAALPTHPIGLLDRLETYAVAALYAHLSATPTDADAAKPLLDEAATLRQVLLIGAEALAHRGVLDAEVVAGIRAGQGNLDTANDLVALGALFAGSWEKVASKTAVERSEVDRAAVLGLELLAALGEREQGGTPSERKEARLRAFTLFVRAYDACRRALVYLRWNEADVGEIAPSLFRLRRGRGTKKDTVVEEEAEAPKKDGAAAPSGDEGAVAEPLQNGAPA